MAPKVNWQSLVNLCLVDFGACSANQCTYNQILNFLAIFLCLIVLFGFLLKLTFQLQKLTSE